MSEVSNFFTDNKDMLTIIVATFAGVVALGTFIKAIIKFRLKGDKKEQNYLIDSKRF